MLYQKLFLLPAALLFAGCASDRFLINGKNPLSKEVLSCMEPADLPSLPADLKGLIGDTKNVNPLNFLSDTLLSEQINVKQIPLLSSISNVTDFSDTFISQMPGIFALLQKTTESTVTENIYKTYIQAYFSKKGFISRSGIKLKFPGLASNEATSTSVDFTQVGSDLVRVFLEALRDGSKGKLDDRLPGVEDSTGVSGCKQDDKNECYLQTASIALQWHVTPDRFEAIETIASQAEATTATAVGKAVRGGFWGSLNNESMAKVAETAAGILARHTVERYEWCKERNKQS